MAAAVATAAARFRFRGGVVYGEGRFDLGAKTQARGDLHAGFERSSSKKRRFCGSAITTTNLLPTVSSGRAQQLRAMVGLINCKVSASTSRGVAVKVRNARGFDERGNEIRLRHSSALQQQFAQVHEFDLLVLNRFVQIFDGNVIPFAEDFSSRFFFMAQASLKLLRQDSIRENSSKQKG